MSLEMPSAAEVQTLRLMTNNAQPEDLVLKLYQNDATPSATSTASAFITATFPGYADVELVPGEWSFTEGNPSVALYNEHVEFASTGGPQTQQIYGYYIVGADSGLLRWAERFDPLPNATIGEENPIRVRPRITLDNAAQG